MCVLWVSRLTCVLTFDVKEGRILCCQTILVWPVSSTFSLSMESKVVFAAGMEGFGVCMWETRKYAHELDESNHERSVCVCVCACVRVCMCVRVFELKKLPCVCVCVQREATSFLCQ